MNRIFFALDGYYDWYALGKTLNLGLRNVYPHIWTAFTPIVREQHGWRQLRL